MSIVTYENVDTPIFDIYYPRYLFASGEGGSLLPDLSAPVDSLFQDASGTTPVTAYGDFVGLAVDQSGNGLDWVQATNAARMRYGRIPRSGVRNRLVSTEDFSNPAWNHRDVDVTQAEAPDGTLTAAKVVVNPNASNDIVGLQQNGASWEPGHRRMQLQAKSAGSRYILWGFYLNTFNYALVQVDLTDGAIVYSRTRGAQYNYSGEPSATAIEDGWYRLSLGYESGISQSSRLTMVGTDVELSDSDQPSFENIPGDGVAGIFIAHPQTEGVGDAIAEPTPYQRVTDQWDITEEGVPDQPILYADLADDAMDIELPAITGGTIVLAGDKGIWIDEFDFAGGTFTYGPTTYTGGPEGLIEGLVGERLIGGFVIDRALAATERAQNIQYYKDRGAPGVWELGPELVSNSDFSDGLDDWTFQTIDGDSGTATVSDGVLTLSAPDGEGYNFYQSDAFPSGGVYVLRWESVGPPTPGVRYRGPEVYANFPPGVDSINRYSSGGRASIQRLDRDGLSTIQLTRVSARKLELVT